MMKYAGVSLLAEIQRHIAKRWGFPGIQLKNTVNGMLSPENGKHLTVNRLILTPDIVKFIYNYLDEDSR